MQTPRAFAIARALAVQEQIDAIKALDPSAKVIDFSSYASAANTLAGEMPRSDSQPKRPSAGARAAKRRQEAKKAKKKRKEK